MTQENKELLLKYLCMALPYEVRISKTIDDFVSEPKLIKSLYPNGAILVEEEFPDVDAWDICEIKPYLRPMSSMTEEEKKEYFNRTMTIDIIKTSKEVIDYCLSHHFDFMGLIPKGMAIEVTEENNPYASD